MKIKISELDRLFSLYVRTLAGWECQRCQKRFKPPTRSLHNSHFHGRRHKSVRFDRENTAALCFGCHRYFTENPLEHTDWFRKRLGTARFNALLLRKNTHGMPDVKLYEIYLKERLKELGVDPNKKKEKK